ncbi:MAG TPA: DUF58 domain-containing protein [Aggregatilinea sp.]|jgi:uncharacterized protein (DUF58 family)|uniref:DUF58 domain-containing protein n=1 Tax=Aggregatilinea sp. TaxID=2806333 RepID=UPI002BCF85E6|nr:DUF58 domain-containing protein [Aggregatilinea sp.]HML20846.1 DUF58 domain-containing protein [Aggregatilinea sp.]
MAERFFDEKTLRKLDRLVLVANQVRAGAIKGERRSARRGTSIEFADYRNYARGDDLRRLDWNIYARLDRPYIKLLEDEEDLAVHIIVDGSASMDWPRAGSREQHKFLYACRVAAGLGAIALSTGDQLSFSMMRQDGIGRWGPFRGRGQVLNLLGWLEKQRTRGLVELNEALRDVARRTTRAGLVVVLTDLMSPEGYQDGLRALQGRGHEVALLQVLSPDEIDPPVMGDLKLIDVETGIPQEVSIDAEMRALYLERFQAWQAEIGMTCARRGIHYAMAQTSTPWEQVILSDLRRASVVR